MEDMAMRNFDLSPLFRSSIGFDRMTRLLDAATRMDDSAFSYPPYNIEKTGENAYRITMAVAGFGEDDLNITVQENSLVISGKLNKSEDEKKYLYRGIAGRAFERRFELAEHIRVSGASLVNGLLHVDLVREVPEAMKPRTIKIEAKGAPVQHQTIESEAA
jgi:molecular chaperone IbpA